MSGPQPLVRALREQVRRLTRRVRILRGLCQTARKEVDEGHTLEAGVALDEAITIAKAKGD